MITQTFWVLVGILSGYGVHASPDGGVGDLGVQSVAPPLNHRLPYESLSETRDMLVPNGTVSVSASAVNTGGMIASAPARHALTGRLRAPLTFRGGSTSKAPLPAGTEVYGTLLNGGRLSWCAPYQALNPRTREQRWEADCAVPALGYVAHAKAFDHGLFAERVRFVGHTQAASVAESPVVFGPSMRIVYRFDGWRRRKALVRAYVEIDGQSGRMPVEYVSSSIQADGSTAVSIMDRTILLRRLGDQAVTVTDMGQPTP